MGLQDIHTICPPSKPCTLRVDMIEIRDLEFAQYDNFSLTGWSDKYRLTVGNYTGGTAIGDRLSYSNKQQFSTFDNDNDASENRNYAQETQSGWWFGQGSTCNLNGVWGNQRTRGRIDGIDWGLHYPFFSEMKVRMQS